MRRSGGDILAIDANSGRHATLANHGSVDKNKLRRLCLAATPGGHLAELESFAGSLSQVDRFLVTIPSTHSSSVLPGVRRYFVRRGERNPINFLVNAIQAIFILVKEKPDAIISTGAGDTLPLLFAGVFLGIPIVFVESMARVHQPSLTGRLIRVWADLTIVHWSSLRGSYRRCVVATPPLGPAPRRLNLPLNPRIMVLTGTGPRGFNRLIEGIDQMVGQGRLASNVFAQIGTSDYLPKHIAYVRFLSHEDLVLAMSAADVVVTHDGAGSIAEALRAAKPTIVVPRNYRLGELTYRSDAELAKHLANLGWVAIVEDPRTIPQAINLLREPAHPPVSIPGKSAGQLINEFLDARWDASSC